jgi:hypothetical protein
MLSATYYRRQADICLRCAEVIDDRRTSRHYESMAEAFMSRAAERENQLLRQLADMDRRGRLRRKRRRPHS